MPASCYRSTATFWLVTNGMRPRHVRGPTLRAITVGRQRWIPRHGPLSSTSFSQSCQPTWRPTRLDMTARRDHPTCWPVCLGLQALNVLNGLVNRFSINSVVSLLLMSGLFVVRIDKKSSWLTYFRTQPGPDLREGKLGSRPGPPQLGGLHKNSKKLLPKET